MNDLDKMSIQDVMKIYRQRLSAEKNKEVHILNKLKENYPKLFSDEFEEFISDMRMSIEYLRNEYGEDFREILESGTQVTIYH